jgi:hypothetical protein
MSHVHGQVHQENLKFYEVQGAVMRVFDGLWLSLKIPRANNLLAQLEFQPNISPSLISSAELKFIYRTVPGPLDVQCDS